jgi:hypothetical protein
VFYVEFNHVVTSQPVGLQHAGTMATRIGGSEEAVSRGLRPAFAAIVGGIASKTSHPGELREILIS